MKIQSFLHFKDAEWSKKRQRRGGGSPANMNQFTNIIFASPIGYDMKHIYRIKTYTCINFNEKNSKKWCIAKDWGVIKNR